MATTYPEIDSVIVSLGPLSLRWYGTMYLLGFAAFYFLGRWRARQDDTWPAQAIADLLFYGVAGVVVGGRVGFVLFYGFESFLRDPLWLFRIWEGGMSFHGGLLGVVAACWWYARKRSRLQAAAGAKARGSPNYPPSVRRFFEVTDFVVPLVPLGLGLGRIGNFINAELPGRVTEFALAVRFPCNSVRDVNLACFGDYENVARHVSSLYQAAAEGLLLFALLWWFASKPRAVGRVSGMFLAGYGLLRFVTEFFRQPDAHMGFVAFDWMSMGQLLSLPMLAAGLFLLFNRAGGGAKTA